MSVGCIGFVTGTELNPSCLEMTRREAIAIGIGLPLFASDTREFWDQKKPEEWTKEERAELLTHSPWAHEAEVKFNGGPGPLGGPEGSLAAEPGVLLTGPMSTTTRSPKKFAATVRWESALPIRQASGNKLDKEAAANYILSVTGDLPMLGGAAAETEDEHQSRLENLKQYTRLEKRGGAVYLANFSDQRGKGVDAGIRFYFERNDAISAHDGSVTFITRLGPIDLKCKFPLKEMVYRGKLEV